MEGTNEQVGNYSKTFYTLLGASIGGILTGGYVTIKSFFSNSKVSETHEYKYNKEKSPALINNQIDNLSPILFNFDKELKDIRFQILQNPDFLSEEITIKILGLIKEYADYLYEKRNSSSITERRKLLSNILKIENNQYKKNSLLSADLKKYEEICGREFYDLYSYALSQARGSIIRKIKIKKGLIESSWEKYSQQEEVYYKINYFSNIFRNLIGEETVLKLQETSKIKNFSFKIDTTDKEFTKELTENLFEEFSKKLIDNVASLEMELSSSNLSSEERDEIYANKLQLIKLRVSDEMYLQHGMDDRLLKYLAIHIFKIIDDNSHEEGNIPILERKFTNEKDLKFKNLLEKVNGIDLISIGL